MPHRAEPPAQSPFGDGGNGIAPDRRLFSTRSPRNPSLTDTSPPSVLRLRKEWPGELIAAQVDVPGGWVPQIAQCRDLAGQLIIGDVQDVDDAVEGGNRPGEKVSPSREVKAALVVKIFGKAFDRACEPVSPYAELL